MNKNKKIISASLALALGVSLLIPNAKANEEETLEKALKEPAKTSETVKTEEKSTVEDKKITIKKVPLKEGDPEKLEGDLEKPEGNPEKPKDEKKVKPKEYKMSELLNEKGAFEKSKKAELDFIGYEIWYSVNGEPPASKEKVDALKHQYEKLQKATTWEEMGEVLGYHKEYFARSLLAMKGVREAHNPELVKIIDDMANHKPQNPSQKNPDRKNKKTSTTNTANTANTGNKVNNAGEDVQTGVGSLSAILGLLGVSSLGLFKSKRK